MGFHCLEMQIQTFIKVFISTLLSQLITYSKMALAQRAITEFPSIITNSCMSTVSQIMNTSEEVVLMLEVRSTRPCAYPSE